MITGRAIYLITALVAFILFADNLDSYGAQTEKSRIEMVQTGEGHKRGMIITEKSRPTASIVIPFNPTLQERFAAEELSKYIKKISGASLPLKNDRERISGNVILVGGPEKNRKSLEYISQESFDKMIPGPEGVMVRTFGEHALILAGSSRNPFEYERGTIYAVYYFLENYLGCSFAAYSKPESEKGAGIESEAGSDLRSDLGEFVPHIETITIPSADYVKRSADLPYRTAIVQYHNTTIAPTHSLNSRFIDWAAKNRYNRILTMESIYSAFKVNGMFEEARKRGFLFTVGHHESSRFFLPPDGNSIFPEKYFATHPEYYRLRKDGTRLHSTTSWKDSWIFCSRNKDAIDQFAGNAKLWLESNPYVDTICIWPNDRSGPQCTCPLCSKYSRVENYTYFVNSVAEKITEKFPDVKIDMLAYSDLFDCPEKTQLGRSLDRSLDRSVVVDISTWSKEGLRHVGNRNGTSLIGTLYDINAQKWHAAGADTVFYEYFMGNFGARQRYIPMADEMQAIFSHFKERGYCMGSGTQVEPFNIWNCLFNFYAHGRTSFDTSLSMDNNLDMFCRIFGRGAPFIKEYIKYAESVLEGEATYDKAGEFFASHMDKKRVYDLFERAFDAESEGTLRDNIRLLRMALRYSDLSTNGNGDAELKYMADHFDSYTNNPGYGIYIAVTGKEGTFIPDRWYNFSKK